MPDIQEHISDDMSRQRRLAAMAEAFENVATEDIELINERFPRMAECALHEILNPNPNANAGEEE